MYKLDASGRPRLNGRFVPADALPTRKRFDTTNGPCVVVARSLKEQVELANAETPEDLEGFTEALTLAQSG